MSKKLAAITLAGLLAFALVACGDDADDEASPEATAATTTADTVTRADFVAEATALCDPLIAAREDLAAEAGLLELTEAPTVEQLQGFYAAFAPVFAQFADDFAALEPAPEDQEAFDAVVPVNQQVAELLTEAGSDPAVTQELLDTDEAAVHEPADAMIALGVPPEC